jgi:hypothetical protein
MAHLTYRPRFTADLDEIYDYIANHRSEESATDQILRLEEAAAARWFFWLLITRIWEPALQTSTPICADSSLIRIISFSTYVTLMKWKPSECYEQIGTT